MTSPHELLHDYLAARGLPMPDGTSARKVAEVAMRVKIGLDTGRGR